MPTFDDDQEYQIVRGSKASQMPSKYDRLMGSLADLPDVHVTTPSIIRVLPNFGIGGSETFVVQTFRHSSQKGDTIFLEHTSIDGTVRIAIPAEVANAIARQRERLTFLSRSRAGKLKAEALKERGELPGFMRNPKPRKKAKKK
jgi:hypothetical protein